MCHNYEVFHETSNVLFVSHSIIQKANNALEVLKEVLDAVDSQNPEVCQMRKTDIC